MVARSESIRAKSSLTAVKCLLTLTTKRRHLALAKTHHTHREFRPREHRDLTWHSTQARVTILIIIPAALPSIQEAQTDLLVPKQSRRPRNQRRSHQSSRPTLKGKSLSLPKMVCRRVTCLKRAKATKVHGMPLCRWKRVRMGKVVRADHDLSDLSRQPNDYKKLGNTYTKSTLSMRANDISMCAANRSLKNASGSKVALLPRNKPFRYSEWQRTSCLTTHGFRRCWRSTPRTQSSWTHW